MGRVDDQGRPIQDAGMRGMLYVELRARSASRDAHSGIGGSIFPNAAWRLTWALQAIKASDGRIRIPGFYDDLRPPSELDLELLSKLPDEGPGLKEKFGVERFLNDVSGEAFKRQYLFEPTCTIGGLTAGYQGPGAKTVLPAEASAKMDFRLLPDQHPDFIYSAMREHLNQEGFEDIELIRLAGEPPARTPPDDPFLQLVVQSAAEVYGTPQRISPLHPGSGPMHAFIQALGIPVAMAGFGYPGTLAHSPNENMVIDYFVKACKHTARVMMHL
jgi:acetylornithine deacetylase/succinyl-diaminopimelate desuccinylase-like protein